MDTSDKHSASIIATIFMRISRRNRWTRALAAASYTCVAFLVSEMVHPTLMLAANTDARIVLHAHPFGSGNICPTPQQVLGLDCNSVRPTVAVSPGQALEIYVYLHAYDSIAGAQMAFSWHSSWSLLYWIGGCRSNEILALPVPQASGDSYVVAFDPITGGLLQPIGRMRFLSGSAGTHFTVSETWAPGGTGVINDQLIFSTIPPNHRGSIGSGVSGIDSCGGKSESAALYEGD